MLWLSTTITRRASVTGVAACCLGTAWIVELIIHRYHCKVFRPYNRSANGLKKLQLCSLPRHIAGCSLGTSARSGYRSRLRAPRKTVAVRWDPALLTFQQARTWACGLTGGYEPGDCLEQRLIVPVCRGEQAVTDRGATIAMTGVKEWRDNARVTRLLGFCGGSLLK